MPAHMYIYKFMFYIYLMKYLFNISEYRAMLIKLLNLSYKYIFYTYVYVCMYICMYILGMGHDFRIFYLIIEYRLGCAIIF